MCFKLIFLIIFIPIIYFLFKFIVFIQYYSTFLNLTHFIFVTIYVIKFLLDSEYFKITISYISLVKLVKSLTSTV